MLTIRLSRTGKRHKPQYRVVLQEKGRDPWSPAIEVLGHYNPHTQPGTVELKEDRVKHWLEQGAQPSNTVHNMFVNAGLVKEDKAKSVTITNKRAGKMADKKAEAEKATAEADTKKAEEEAAKAQEAEAAEAPTQEAAPAPEAATEEKTEEAKAEEPKEETPAEEEKSE